MIGSKKERGLNEPAVRPIQPAQEVVVPRYTVIWRMNRLRDHHFLSSVSNSGSMQSRKDENRYRNRSKHMSQQELEHDTKQREDQEALKRIKKVCPQCSESLYHFNSTKLLEQHICCEAMMPRDVLSTAMQHANGLLTRMEFSVNN